MRTAISTFSIRHMYHIKRLLCLHQQPQHFQHLGLVSHHITYLYGANLAANSSISFSDIYLNLPPPFPFNLLTSLPTKAAHPRLITNQQIIRRTSRKTKVTNSLNPQIPRRKNINPLQGKTSKHLNRPPSQPPNSSKSLNKLLI